MKKNNLAWLLYTIFVLLAILGNGNESPIISSGPYSVGKYIMWTLFLGFTAYTYHCSQHENLFRTIKVMRGLYWGRQIGIDLYIGLFLFLGLVLLHQQSLLITALWLIPVVAFGNLATLLYVALHYDSIIKLF